MSISGDLKDLANILKKLKREDVINSSRFTGDIGEYLVRRKFKLKRPPKEKKTGCDFIKGNKRIQVKTRTSIFNENPNIVCAFDINKLYFDVCWRVVLDRNFQLKEIWEIPQKVVKKQLEKGKDKTRFSFSEEVKKKSQKIFKK